MKKLLSIIPVIIILSGNIYADDFIAIREQIRNPDLTELQRKKMIEPYFGKKVLWQGWVEDVKEEESGGYVCFVDMDSPEVFFSVYDLKIQVDSELALKLRKNQIVYVTGVIKSIDVVAGIFSVELINPKLITQKPEIDKK